MHISTDSDTDMRSVKSAPAELSSGEEVEEDDQEMSSPTASQGESLEEEDSGKWNRQTDELVLRVVDQLEGEEGSD